MDLSDMIGLVQVTENETISRSSLNSQRGRFCLIKRKQKSKHNFGFIFSYLGEEDLCVTDSELLEETLLHDKLAFEKNSDDLPLLQSQHYEILSLGRYLVQENSIVLNSPGFDIYREQTPQNNSLLNDRTVFYLGQSLKFKLANN